MSLMPMPDFWKWFFGAVLLVMAVACFIRPHWSRKRNQGGDVWLREAVFYAVRGRWLSETEPAFTEDGQFERSSDIVQGMRQLARDGRMTIWGKIWENSTFDPIPSEYWVIHRISLLSILNDQPSDTKTEKATYEGIGPIYKELRANSTEIESIWEPKREKLKLRLPFGIGS